MGLGLRSNFGLSQACQLLPVRKKTDNKATGGKCLIIAGSKGMFGAAVLTATAAARSGAGYVILMTDKKKFSSADHPDFLTVDFNTSAFKVNSYSSIAIGPGLGQSQTSLKILKHLFKIKAQNIVIDADALNLCAQYKLFPFLDTWVATPHEGELARLLNMKTDVIKKNRLAAVHKAQNKLGCTVLLKGAETLVATSQKTFVISAGNSALAKAGTGDVLTGIIAAFLAQGLVAEKAACLAAFVHGYMADQWIRNKKDHLSLMASDLIKDLPLALKKIRKTKIRKTKI